MEPVLQQALDQNPFIQFMYVTNLEGRKITRNITHIVDRAKYAEMKLDEDLSNRSWFIEPMKSGKVFVSDFYTSRFTGALCITVSVPVRNDSRRNPGHPGPGYPLRGPGQDGAGRGDLGTRGQGPVAGSQQIKKDRLREGL